jgi:ribosomal protein S18 acetylase RimI-like enzyme
MSFTIRPFHYTDLDALIQIATISFAEEYTIQGATPDSFTREIRLATRGRMIPLKLLTRLAGYRWAIFVAEVEGRLVGCGGYMGMGRAQMELSNLMVHPDYRRRGIGQALLETRLAHLRQDGYRLVTTSILSTNVASLGNIQKQGFELFDEYTLWEHPLPLPTDPLMAAAPLLSRLVAKKDIEQFKRLEGQIATPLWLEVQGSAADYYFPSWGASALNRFSGGQHWAHIFELENRVIGFLLAHASSGQSKGNLSRPVVADVGLSYLPIMLAEAANWLAQQGKETIQLSVPAQRMEIADQLTAAGWQKKETWLRFVKRL